MPKAKDSVVEEKKESPFRKFGFKTPQDKAEEYKNKRVYYIKPLQLALSFARRDPITKMPGVPMGTILEFAGKPGGGKCFGINTIILMYDGSIKKVQDVIVGDQVMGPDSKPRNVLSLGRGRDTMYEIIPTKGDSFVCNSEHILSLINTQNVPAMRKRVDGSLHRRSKIRYGGQKIINVSVKEYLTWSKSKKYRFKLYRSEQVDFKNETNLPIDPYFMGLWLGDGTSGFPHVTSMDDEIINYLFEFVKNYQELHIRVSVKPNNKASTYHLSTDNGGRPVNPLLDELRILNVLNNKHIPSIYKTASTSDRLQLLAGLIDSDGYTNGHGGYIISQKSKILSKDIDFMVRSLGFAAYTKEFEGGCNYKGEWRPGTYYRTSISGDLSLLPGKLKRKQVESRKQVKDVLHTGFTVKELPEDDYYGFAVDGDHLFLLDDFTVVHNSLCGEQFSIEILKENKKNQVAFLNFEPADEERTAYLFKDYIKEERVWILDYTNPELTCAEDGLDVILKIAEKKVAGTDFQDLVAIFIDSFGFMPTRKELYDDKGELKTMDMKTQLAIRASKVKDFITRYYCLNPNTRPILFVVNHMTNQIDSEGFGVDPMEVSKVGFDLNYPTACGYKKDFAFGVRVRCDAKKYSRKDAEKHEETGGKVYDALEVQYEIYRSKLLPGRHWARAIYNMEDRTNCHYEEEIELLGVASYLDVGDIVKLPRNKWKIKGEEMSEEKAITYLKDRPELVRELIIECAKPGNPERFHAPKGKMDVASQNAEDLL